jgi:hypothetical protein
MDMDTQRFFTQRRLPYITSRNPLPREQRWYAHALRMCGLWQMGLRPTPNWRVMCGREGGWRSRGESSYIADPCGSVLPFGVHPKRSTLIGQHYFVDLAAPYPCDDIKESDVAGKAEWEAVQPRLVLDSLMDAQLWKALRKSKRNGLRVDPSVVGLLALWVEEQLADIAEVRARIRANEAEAALTMLATSRVSS